VKTSKEKLTISRGKQSKTLHLVAGGKLNEKEFIFIGILTRLIKDVRMEENEVEK
jgi:hypothetical protein